MKGDVFEQMVEKVVFGDCDDVLKGEAVTLLRAQHEKVVRMVERSKYITVAALKKHIIAALGKMAGKVKR